MEGEGIQLGNQPQHATALSEIGQGSAQEDNQPVMIPLKVPSVKIKRYSVSANGKLGKTIIINNLTESEMGKGITTDQLRLRHVLNKIGFKKEQQTSYQICKLEQMKKIFKDAADDPEHEKYDAFCCVILSHGGKKNGEEYILSADQRSIKLKEIVDYFRADNCKGLIGKPKIFFIEACRGHEEDSGTSVVRLGSTEEETIPNTADSFVFQSSAYSYVSYRHSDGSRFIQCLCKALDECYGDKYGIMDIATVVCGMVASMEFGAGKEMVKQMPQITSTLRKKFCFKGQD